MTASPFTTIGLNGPETMIKEAYAYTLYTM